MDVTNFELIEIVRTTEMNENVKKAAEKELLARIVTCDNSRHRPVHKDK